MHRLGRHSCLLGLVCCRAWARLSAHSTPALSFRKEGAGTLSRMGSLPWGLYSEGSPRRENC